MGQRGPQQRTSSRKTFSVTGRCGPRAPVKMLDWLFSSRGFGRELRPLGHDCCGDCCWKNWCCWKRLCLLFVGMSCLWALSSTPCRTARIARMPAATCNHWVCAHEGLPFCQEESLELQACRQGVWLHACDLRDLKKKITRLHCGATPQCGGRGCRTRACLADCPSPQKCTLGQLGRLVKCLCLLGATS
jgi:hypothetical protein